MAGAMAISGLTFPDYTFADNFQLIRGQLWGRLGVDIGSIWGRFGVNFGSVWDPFGVSFGSFLGSVW